MYAEAHLDISQNCHNGICMSENKRTEVAKVIKEIRESKGISQRALARKLGMDPGALNRIENGSGNLLTNTLFDIAEALDVDPALFLGQQSEAFRHLWSVFEELSPERQQRVLEQLDDLLLAERSTPQKPPSV